MRDIKDQLDKYPLSKKERANYLIKLQQKDSATDLQKSCISEYMSEQKLLQDSKQSIIDIVNQC